MNFNVNHINGAIARLVEKKIKRLIRMIFSMTHMAKSKMIGNIFLFTLKKVR
jgi:hypothetical protein